MKIFRNIFMTVLVLGILLIPSLDSRAADPEAYTYKVTFYSGLQGTFDGGSDTIVHADIPSGSHLFFTAQSAVHLNKDSKYYVKGVRPAGRDNAEAEMSTLTLNVNKDADYVVVYGIKGDQVGYTIRYQDADGKKLAENDVFYGNVGDKPVVAYRYIDGYVPKVFGLTKTLSANEADNVFTFVYEEAEDGVTYVEGSTTILYKDTKVTIIRGGSTGSGSGTGSAAANETSQETSDDAQTGGEETAGSNIEEQEIVDLDEEETPLGNIDLKKDETKKNVPMVMILSLTAMGILALIVLVILIFRMKERMKNHER